MVILLRYSFTNLSVVGAKAQDGDEEFLYADAWFDIQLPSDSSIPDMNTVVYPPNSRTGTNILITANITDAARGNHGISTATAEYWYDVVENAQSVIGTSPGGNGDGTWSFSIPEQFGHGGETLQFRLTGIDGVGRSVTSGNYNILIIDDLTDSDRDNLPDWWEMREFNSLSYDWIGDKDGDGVENGLEYLQGTMPNDASDASLLGDWSFDNSTADDVSGHGLNGTLLGSPTFSASSIEGAKSIALNAAGDRINLGFSPVLKAEVFSLSGYISPEYIPSGDNQAVIWDALSASAGCRIYLNSEGQLCVLTRDGGQESIIESEVSLRSGEWVALAIASDSNILKLYMDGFLIASADMSGSFVAAAMSQSVYLGNVSGGDASTQYFGLLDEFKLWNCVLSDREVMLLTGVYVESFDSDPGWSTGFGDGQYATDDSSMFYWNDIDSNMTINVPNKALNTDEPYAHTSFGRKGSSFTFMFDMMATYPGYESPLRIGLKQNPAANWGSDKGLSCTLAFRATGFSLELYSKDGSNYVKSKEWPDGFQTYDPPRWVSGIYSYDAVDETLSFELKNGETGELLASHMFTGVNAFPLDMDNIVISARGDSHNTSGYQDHVEGAFDNLLYLPYSVKSSEIKGDLTGDRIINFMDMDAFSRCYGSVDGDAGYNERADFDGDGDVDFMDMDAFSRVWGQQY